MNKGALKEPGIDDVNDFKQLENAMNAVGMAMSKKADIFRVTAAVLHLGNISFQESTKDKKGETAKINCYSSGHASCCCQFLICNGNVNPSCTKYSAVAI